MGLMGRGRGVLCPWGQKADRMGIALVTPRPQSSAPAQGLRPDPAEVRSEG